MLIREQKWKGSTQALSRNMKVNRRILPKTFQSVVDISVSELVKFRSSAPSSSFG